MPVSVVIGGQFGSEGKGKVAHFLAEERKAQCAIRVGGGNSGHTVIRSDRSALILRQLPTAALLPRVMAILPPGSYISVRSLLEEIEILGLHPDRLIIDPLALIVEDSHVFKEKSGDLRRRIGSTCSGVGEVIRERVSRLGTLSYARDAPSLRRFVASTSEILRGLLADNARVVLEGTQGFGLSPIHSPMYPYVTSRDTTAAAFLSEAGLSPLDVDEVALVIRAFPIRVPGESGPLPREISWRQVTELSGSLDELIEFTSVTGLVRRVAEFDEEVVLGAIRVNNPTMVVMNHLDYVDISARYRGPTAAIEEFIARVEGRISRRIDYFGTGPSELVPRCAAARSCTHSNVERQRSDL